jgi:hypothetical protein
LIGIGFTWARFARLGEIEVNRLAHVGIEASLTLKFPRFSQVKLEPSALTLCAALIESISPARPVAYENPLMFPQGTSVSILSKISVLSRQLESEKTIRAPMS